MISPEERSANLQLALEHWSAGAAADGTHAYLVIDGSWQEDLVKLTRAKPHGWEPLFGQPNLPRDEAHARSPLLIDLAQRPELIPFWIEDGFPRRLGIVVFMAHDLSAARTRLKRFQSVLIPSQDEPAYFRFFDGRTLSCFLSTGFSEQWEDFMSGIDTVAAPTDLTQGWTLYRMEEGALLRGIETSPGAEYEWTPIEPQPTDEGYHMAQPFRRIDAPQFEALTACVQRGFYTEITVFIADAFPDLPRAQEHDNVYQLVVAAAETARGKGHEEEDEIYYWAVLTFLLGPDFDQEPKVAKHLAKRHLDMAGKLEQLLSILNETIGSPALTELIDTEESHFEYSDGSKLSFRRRSGKVLEDSRK
ncbi:DUF4123 domain-containing protein [Litoreibacter janthinus]|uniref:DUF4123 domain-containing protein n=1 Tax=Litoreibacter janthinus TaxID=670154 RepID=A0A1I6HD69_9RHOB|nr:DUF4123 domain-containing protein [Litoreibacter janthinus]SFR52324.1 protein of unknown function [Litoreibacter janthinus]